MPAKPKNPPRAVPQPKPAPTRKPDPRALPSADSRWQRTVRYGWDKGGARGGR